MVLVHDDGLRSLSQSFQPASYKLDPINPDGSSASFKTGGFMPVLAPPSPISGDLEMELDFADPNSGDWDGELDEDDIFRRQRPHRLILAHLYNVGE